MHVIGTAGHVDHGKSTLIERLTGIDPDRLAEEKERGLTIDLGFAWLRLPSGREVGIVDVPGHERFIKNMLAGSGAVGVCLFVVAANEGWMPQSQEHFEIIDLLGVSAGVVAITKKDTVDEPDFQKVADDVAERLVGSSLSGVEIIGVSPVTDEGMDDLVAELDRVLRSTPPAPDNGRPRLFVDRVFTIKGSGTVVTGTLIDGELEEGLEVEILPEGHTARIRSIQSHERSTKKLGPGNRCALNLVGVDRTSIQRGDVVVARGTWRATDRLAVDIKFLSEMEPTEKGAFRLHLGSSETGVRVRLLDRFAILHPDRPVIADFGDKFVLRDVGRRATAAGGRVIDPHMPPYKRSDPRVLEGLRRRLDADRHAFARITVEERGHISKEDLAVMSGLSLEDPGVIELNSYFVSPAAMSRWKDAVSAEAGRYQASHPNEAGLPRTSAQPLVSTDPKLASEVLTYLEENGTIVADSEVIRTPDFSPEVGGEEAERLLDSLRSSGSSPPLLKELRQQHDASLIRSLIRAGRLIEVTTELVYLKETLDDIAERTTRAIDEEGPVTVAEFRDLVGTTRKYAVPLLEYLDRVGITRRDGDVRTRGSAASSDRRLP